jgi:hypothetical protein
LQYPNDDVDYALVNGISQEIVRKGSRIARIVYHFGTRIKNDYICRSKCNAMVVVSSREFRANQRKYFALARVNDVVITSRSHGSYRLVPISESDTLIDRDTLDAKIRQGIADYESGKVHRMEEGESSEEFLTRMINEQ